MRYFNTKTIVAFVIVINSFGCKNQNCTNQSENADNEFIVELPQVSYPLPIVDHIANNCDMQKKRSLKDNPAAYILQGINDVWKGTTDAYQNSSTINGPGINDYIKGNPIIDSVIWKENIQYCIKVTNNRTTDETILAYLDDVRSKYYSVIDGFGPLTEDYVKNSGAYVTLPSIPTNLILNDTHFQSTYNNGSIYSGFENSTLGAVVKLAKNFQQTCSSTNAPKYLFSTPRPWRMNNTGAIKFLGTTYDTVSHKPTYNCKYYDGKDTFKIFDKYESDVKVVPGLRCSRKNHQDIYDDNNPSPNDLYTNITENIRTDNAFPSGHTNAGTLISLAYAYAFPERFTELVFRGAQLGENRIVAGMHSPVDVIGGKTMALAVVCAALNQPETAKNAEAALQSTLDFFGAKADSANMSLYDYAHRKVENPTGYTIGANVNIEVFNNNIYDNKTKAKKIYRERLTYGFTQDKEKSGQKPVVPKGAEAILKSRFPYLTDNQRRAVLYTTEIASGYKIIDKTNGWGRIDLVTAADGYGSFIGNVNVNMDASLGRFNAQDSWGNDIDGSGCLIKNGTGKLILTGNNTYNGGTIINEGTLATTSNNALGFGNVSINEQGTLEVYQPLNIKGKFTQTNGTVLVHIISDSATYIKVNKQVSLQNSTLVVVFDEKNQPKTGDRIPIIQGDEILGDFENVTAKGYQCICEKIDNTIYLMIE